MARPSSRATVIAAPPGFANRLRRGPHGHNPTCQKDLRKA
ncbi:hypothetical protein C4K08_1127 [Pseudomonas chlororaphis subsp. aureofaciens]|nr:hypothetical protein C4K08_1127 [Pseudomonas chlororaphis subsp. aureofaciens]